MRGREFIRHLENDEATARLGDDIAAALRPGDVVFLHGDLGMGKSALARAIIRAIAGDDTLEVPSPTYTLMQEYPLRLPVHHLDLYRLSEPGELAELGVEEVAAEGALLVEWPERAEGALEATITIRLSEAGEGRDAAVSAGEEAARRLEHSFAVRRFLVDAGCKDASRRFLLGDASIRAYETVHMEGRKAAILMDAPARGDEPVVRDGRPYSHIARLAQSVSAFIGIANGLRAQGFAAPKIYAQALEDGLLLIEHLGSGAFLENGLPVPERYEAAGALLARLHQRDWPARFPVAEGQEHQLQPYDRQAMGIEIELCLDWYLPYRFGRNPSDQERQQFLDLWEKLFSRLEQAEQSLVLRDYHSPNIIWRQECEGDDRLGLIDVQDALRGPAAYDLSSLAFDARIDISNPLRQRILQAYCDARTDAAFDRDALEEAFALTAAQRNTKLLGTFVRLCKRDGKSGYLAHLPRIRAYLREAIRHPALAELAEFYARHRLLDEDVHD
ncbi:tRNA (adenosine(37)-N6)-threonylcarbamoyltransferase complex ATPase subunit type 1 TsaE [Nitratireductor basaltis]|uniref:tRNA threonylcarbamoyladenosine biosynthesis protein TsaE n=1 Tax=Nitratireductor basaltis TaxID=472175 RepID=A0A084U693_9HYPH|nr:tRNA (adenosine(37)-N6)-threonylcarbamoyltransferase complex ATPase subunit type 1 TsaE [Nitratireductor basaltis]KFB08479.1 ATPase, YjeE family [Nitratireductor basaltis]